MKKETGKQQAAVQTAKVTKKGAVELTEQSLDQAAGGRKAGGTQQDYLKL